MKKIVVSIILFTGLVLYTQAQDINITTSFDTSRIMIGDQIHYTVTIDQPSNVNLDIPYFIDTLCKSIEIISGPLRDSSFIDSDRIKITDKYLITSFDSGYYEISPVYTELKNETGLKRYYSDYSQLEVIRVNITPSDTTAKIFDIVGPAKAPLTLEEIIPWLLLVTLIGLVIWAVVKYLPHMKKNKTVAEVVKNPDPAHIIAFRDLEKLKEEQVWQKGEVKLYYSRLTEILRKYLENRFAVYSLELTTDETLAALIKTGFKKDQSYNQLKGVLGSADLVKFAKFNPKAEDNDNYFINSWDFVESTMENIVDDEIELQEDKTVKEEEK